MTPVCRRRNRARLPHRITNVVQERGPSSPWAQLSVLLRFKNAWMTRVNSALAACLDACCGKRDTECRAMPYFLTLAYATRILWPAVTAADGTITQR